MPIVYKGPPPETTEPRAPGTDVIDRDLAEALGMGDGGAGRARTGGYAQPADPHRFSILGFLLALLTAAGVAAAITLLYNGTAVIMQTEGGFVAAGGPYVIAHPAPSWVWLIPVSIWVGVAFMALNLFASARGWGVNLMLFMWMGLFISLGWNFLRFGFNPPPGTRGAWGWIVCGIVFWIMGFAPVFMLFGSLRGGFERLVDRQSSGDARRAWRVPRRSDTTGVYIAGQVLGAVVGVAAGVLLFAAVCGLNPAFYGTWTSAGGAESLEFSRNSTVLYGSGDGAETLGTWTARDPAGDDQTEPQPPDADAFLSIPSEKMWYLPYARLTDGDTFELLDEDGNAQGTFTRAD